MHGEPLIPCIHDDDVNSNCLQNYQCLEICCIYLHVLKKCFPTSSYTTKAVHASDEIINNSIQIPYTEFS